MAQARSNTCFFERDPSLPVLRRAGAEAVGTFFLILIAIGSGQALMQVGGESPAFILVASAVATAGVLIGLVIAFGEISGGHFNPLITGLQWLAGERSRRCTLFYIGAQCLGAAFAALAIGQLFAVAPLAHVLSPRADRAFSEVIATAGLMMVIFACARTGRKETGPFASGVWLLGCIVAIPAGFFANPAFIVAMLFGKGALSYSGWEAGAYFLAQLVGGICALAIVSAIYPKTTVGAGGPSVPVEPEAA